MKAKTKTFYMNKAQRYLFQIAPRNLVAIASRRFGKSEGIIMPRLLQNVQSMPGSGGGIVASTYKQALTRTLPATFHALERLGYREGIHYFVGRKAPKTAGFKEPIIKPRQWDYYIHWYNGSVNAIISQDIPYSSNSLTLDYIIGDEAKTLNKDKLNNETLPAVSGMAQFSDNPWHTGYTFVSDMPTNNLGKWLNDEEENMDTELLEVLHGLLYELYLLSDIDVTGKRYAAKRKQLKNEINLLRKELTLYVEYSILENLEIVGERYVKDMHRNLTPFIFRTAILTQRSNKTEGSFYAALDAKKHYYDAYDNSYLNRFRSDYGDIDWKAAAEHAYNCEQDQDIDYNKPLMIASDTNININWLVVAQADYERNKLNTINSFWLKHPAMLTEVCHAFADYYEPLPNKSVIFYFDSTFLQGKSGTHSEAFYETITRVLTERGWIVSEQYIGQPMKHNEKHKEIDDALKGRRGLTPTFNRVNNETLLDGMERTGTKVTTRGWGKDKSGEKKPDTSDDPVELRTDGGDAWDTVFIGANNFRVNDIQHNISLSNYFG